MTNKIKIIDLLNKMANKKNMPKIVKFQNYIYEFEDFRNDYVIVNNGFNQNLSSSFLFFGIFSKNTNYLNDYVEIIEEVEKPKEIDSLELVDFPRFKNMCPEERYIITAKEYEKIEELRNAVNYLLKKEESKNNNEEV